MNNEFDELKAVRYMRSTLSEEKKALYSNDDLLLLIDALYDFYDETDDFWADEEPALDDAIAYVKKALRSDKDNVIDLDDVEGLIAAEIEYEKSLDI